MSRSRGVLLTATAALAVGVPFVVNPAQAASASVSGVVWYDLDGDGVRDAGEQPLVDQVVFLHRADGTRLGGTWTDAAGSYTFSGVAAGSYTVRYSDYNWEQLWDAWVPSTTGSVKPVRSVTVSDNAVADIGWRPIQRSTDPARPLSTAATSRGSAVASYTDAVPATAVAAALDSGSLLGPEGATTTIRFGLYDRGYCATAVSGRPGSYTNPSATCYIDYRSWLRHDDAILFHEYGHAWASYHEHVTQQDGDWSGYLTARGLAGDSRVGTSYAWYPEELLAEDYRQLFGSATAKRMPQTNTEIPPAADVPGLATYLSSTYVGRTSSPSPTQSPSASPSPAPSPSPSPTTSPTPSPAPSPTLSPPAGSWVAVGDLAAAGASTRTGWTATSTVLAVSSAGEPVAGASVSVAWTSSKGSSGSATCTTSRAGTCTVTSAGLPKNHDRVTFTVRGISTSGLPYAPERNSDADGDSNGTSISVRKPA